MLSLLLLVVVTLGGTSAGSELTYRYLGGAWHESRALSIGGVCTTSYIPDGDGRIEAPAVVGGACAIFLGESTRALVEVIDEVWGPITFRWTLSDWAVPGACFQSSAATGRAELILPDGCEMLDVKLPDFATSGTITVRLS